jgi:glycosyltransferase involved in cell wall biosynthesis
VVTATRNAPRRSSRPIRAAFYGDIESSTNPGGGEIQLAKTAESMRRLGPEVRILDGPNDSLDDCDWLHIFGTLRHSIPLVERAKRRGIHVALSTISWYDPLVSWRLEPTLWRRLRSVAGWGVRRVASNVPSWRRRLLWLCDLLLPNSSAEAKQLEVLFGVPRSKVVVVPNGVDARFARADRTLFQQRYGVHEFVLVPGRIEPRKNQLHVLRSLWGSGFPVVVLGDPHPDHRSYFEACRREADSGVTFVSRLDHDSPLLASAYAAARVVVLASWFETPGLAALEGALAGAEIVITELGSTREYFEEYVRYVPPNDGWRIRQAVRAAFRGERNGAFREIVRQRYGWDRAAARTLDAYRLILEESDGAAPLDGLAAAA